MNTIQTQIAEALSPHTMPRPEKRKRRAKEVRSANRANAAKRTRTFHCDPSDLSGRVNSKHFGKRGLSRSKLNNVDHAE